MASAKKKEEKIKILKRSNSNKMIAGICGGLGKYTKTDPTIIRVIYVLLSVFTGLIPGIVAYIILWIIIPEED